MKIQIFQIRRLHMRMFFLNSEMLIDSWTSVFVCRMKSNLCRFRNVVNNCLDELSTACANIPS